MLIGVGSLAGRGVYAARDFEAGEVVLGYRLRPLDEAEYRALPAGEELFVHSYGGRRFLYPSPARFVNHADEPSCYQDFDRGCDVALRPISRGEPITIDAGEETARELSSFLDAYRDGVGGLVAADAVCWADGRRVAELGDDTRRSIAGPQWLIGTGRWEALCSAGVTAGGGPRRLSMLLKVITGNWQIVYQHLG
ncbi:hypothetical protein BXY51_008461 [Actinoplanes cyaneus]|nr:hypothetical protein [Actinoplanes cyaneus]